MYDLCDEKKGTREGGGGGTMKVRVGCFVGLLAFSLPPPFPFPLSPDLFQGSQSFVLIQNFLKKAGKKETKLEAETAEASQTKRACFR